MGKLLPSTDARLSAEYFGRRAAAPRLNAKQAASKKVPWIAGRPLPLAKVTSAAGPAGALSASGLAAYNVQRNRGALGKLSSLDHVVSAADRARWYLGKRQHTVNHDALVDTEGNIPPANVRGATSYCSETRMSVVECDVPSESALGKALIERADYSDAYRAPLRRPETGVIEIFFAIFAHRPVWMNLILIARNKVAGFAGLETPTTSEILNMEKRDRYIVGQKIGPWPIFFLGPDELVAGRDNKHMDFRLSIMKVRDGNGPSVVVSTLCMVHNRFGRYYLSSITPFHKFGLRKLMASALAAERL